MGITTLNTIRYEMHTQSDKNGEKLPEAGVFVVKCDIEGFRAMARADQQAGVKFDGNDNNIVNRKQYEELLRLGIPHEIVSAPSSYKPPVVKDKRQ